MHSPNFLRKLGEICTVGEVIQVVSASVLRATTIKRSSTFLVMKSAPPRQNPGYAYAPSVFNWGNTYCLFIKTYKPQCLTDRCRETTCVNRCQGLLFEDLLCPTFVTYFRIIFARNLRCPIIASLGCRVSAVV